jgi:hypothetical protein
MLVFYSSHGSILLTFAVHLICRYADKDKQVHPYQPWTDKGEKAEQHFRAYKVRQPVRVVWWCVCVCVGGWGGGGGGGGPRRNTPRGTETPPTPPPPPPPPILQASQNVLEWTVYYLPLAWFHAVYTPAIPLVGQYMPWAGAVRYPDP